MPWIPDSRALLPKGWGDLRFSAYCGLKSRVSWTLLPAVRAHQAPSPASPPPASEASPCPALISTQSPWGLFFKRLFHSSSSVCSVRLILTSSGHRGWASMPRGHRSHMEAPRLTLSPRRWGLGDSIHVRLGDEAQNSPTGSRNRDQSGLGWYGEPIICREFRPCQ